MEEIRTLHREGEELSFNAAQENHLNLLRAATWNYGSWKAAIELSGLNYEEISRYRRWTRERVLAAIRAHHAAGRDLSWHSVSHVVDPPLAAAALRAGVGFESWREALTAAGIAPDDVARYQHWTREKVVVAIQNLAEKGEPLSSQLVQRGHQSLFCAARRRFKTWNGALEAAGIAPETVRLRRTAPPKPPQALQTARSKKPAEKPVKLRSAGVMRS